MTACHRALITCLIFLIFLALLVSRLDSRDQWNWFVVFIPLWVYDFILIFYVAFNMISHCKNGVDRTGTSFPRKLWYITAVMLMMTSQLLLCLKLEYPSWGILTYYVVLPMWTLLVVLCVDIFMMLIQQRRARF